MGQTLGSYCIYVTDLDRATYFWETLMGIKVQLDTDLGHIKERVFASDEGGSRLQLAHHLEHEGPLDHGFALWKLYVNTDDCEGVYQRAVEAGCESVSPPKRLDRWPVVVAFIKDFDGYLIELVQRDPD